MSATDHFSSIDETIRRIKDQFEEELKAAKDALLAAQIHATMCEARMKEALLDRDAHMRVSTKLIAQFGLVEQVFADAKRLALAHFGEPTTSETTVLPPNQLETEHKILNKDQPE